jgi:hypothetical protein
MAKNLITQNPYTVTGVKPGQWFLDSTEDYSTLIAPGYLSSVANAGIDFQPNDFVFAQYNNGENVGLFNVIEATPGIFSLAVYSPNSNSFVFERTIFVAKGGSDLNPGTTMGLPKLTIGGAIAALNPNLNDPSLVVVMDDGTYNENLVLPNNISIYGPNCIIGSQNGDTITINDSGQNTFAVVRVSNLGAENGNAVVINGTLSVLYCDCPILFGNVVNNGAFVAKNGLALINSIVTFGANAQGALYFTNAIGSSLNIDPTATLIGSIGTIAPGAAANVIYGNTSFFNKLTFQTAPIDEVAGRSIVLDDASARIVYNNAADDNFVLPATADVALPIGTNIEFTQLGLGAIDFIAGPGVTLVSPIGNPLATSGTGATAKAWKYTDTIWILSGDLVNVGP